MRILIVDDSEAICTLLATRLRQAGHLPLVAMSGEEAWTILLADAVDLIICDWEMPGLTGVELCRRIRKHRFSRYHYIVMCTARDERQDLIAGMDSGADDFIVKPIDFGELSARLRAGERILALQSELAGKNERLEQTNDELNAAYQRIEADLSAAAEMQLRLLPPPSEPYPSLHLDWLFTPSRFLAGDMLNYFVVGDNLVFYQLDVSGHGVPAALLSFTLNKLLLPAPGSPVLKSDGISYSAASPATVVNELNRRFQTEYDTYFTIVYGVLNFRTREVRFCQAGHPAPVHISSTGVTHCGTGGYPVGLLPDLAYDETTIQLAPGDRLVLYSDGVTDSAGPGEEIYGQDRFSALLHRTKPGSLREMIESVDLSLANWRKNAELADDLSLLALEFV